jgi:hypothetical protein
VNKVRRKLYARKIGTSPRENLQGSSDKISIYRHESSISSGTYRIREPDKDKE